MAKNTKGFFKMEMLLLKIISEGDCYGYQIVQTLDKISNGTIHIAEGTMYPILYRLLDEGLISDEKRLVGKRQTRIYFTEPISSLISARACAILLGFLCFHLSCSMLSTCSYVKDDNSRFNSLTFKAIAR